MAAASFWAHASVRARCEHAARGVACKRVRDTRICIAMVDTPAALRACLASLYEGADADDFRISLDLEGVNLGAHGELCVLHLSASNAPQCVWVIDVTTLGADAFRTPLDESDFARVSARAAAKVRGGGVASRTAAAAARPTEVAAAECTLTRLLEAAAVPKLMWDLRSDFNALYFQYGIRLAGVRDLQLICMVMLLCTRPVERLPGLALAIEKNGAATGLFKRERVVFQKMSEAGRLIFDPKQGGRYEAWKQRPLPRDLLLYCADSTVFAAMEVYWAEKIAPHTAALADATERRLAQAAHIDFTRLYCNSNVDPELVRAVRAASATAPPTYVSHGYGGSSGRGRRPRRNDQAREFDDDSESD